MMQMRARNPNTWPCEYCTPVLGLTCAVNPVNFYFNERADAHDRYAWYKQREIPVFLNALTPSTVSVRRTMRPWPVLVM